MLYVWLYTCLFDLMLRYINHRRLCSSGSFCLANISYEFSIATRPTDGEAEESGFHSWQRQEDSALFTVSETVFAVLESSQWIQWVPRAFSSEVKQPGHEVENSSPLHG
jgi:hypothetical protein